MLSLLYGPVLTSIHDYWKDLSFDCTSLCKFDLPLFGQKHTIPVFIVCLHFLRSICSSKMFVFVCPLLGGGAERSFTQHPNIHDLRVSFLKQITATRLSLKSSQLLPLKLLENPRWLFWTSDPAWFDLRSCLSASFHTAPLFMTFQPLSFLPLKYTKFFLLWPLTGNFYLLTTFTHFSPTFPAFGNHQSVL